MRLCQAGFSLIEVLVAMAIMIVIIVTVTNMFRDASAAWDMGTQRAEMNTSARAAMEYMTRELSCAFVGSIINAAQDAPLTLIEFKLAPDADNNVGELSFAALSGDDRTLRGIRFRYDSTNRTIETARETGSFQPYVAGWGGWSPPPKLLITNVWRFQVIAYAMEDDMKTGNSSPSYNSSIILPAAVDISVEMLNERDMARALSLLVGPQQDGFVMTNSRVYTTRVYFPNRGGGR